MFYLIVNFIVRFIGHNTHRVRVHGIPREAPSEGYLLACAHVSHLDPVCVAGLWPRRVGWMARAEFYQRRWLAWCLRAVHAFPVRRQGVPVRAIREALSRLGRGEIVGIFPEGQVESGRASVLRGGRIKRGVCLLAARSGKPVLPCVIVGTDKLQSVSTYLPYRRGRLWVMCGDFVEPVTGPDRRRARAQMAAELERAYVRLYEELRERWQLADTVVP